MSFTVFNLCDYTCISNMVSNHMWSFAPFLIQISIAYNKYGRSSMHWSLSLLFERSSMLGVLHAQRAYLGQVNDSILCKHRFQLGMPYVSIKKDFVCPRYAHFSLVIQRGKHFSFLMLKVLNLFYAKFLVYLIFRTNSFDSWHSFTNLHMLFALHFE